jgi:hypothetical protein
VRDPHVDSLTYQLVLSERTSFVENVKPIEDENDAFSMRLDDSVVTFEMHEHHASEASACQAVEPYLRAWEVHDALRTGRPEIRFEFERAQVIDRNPPPPPQPGEPVTVEGTATLSTKVSISATGTVTRASYPKPPKDFALDPDVETLWQRWEGYLARRESLQAMAYFCLTVLEHGHGGRAGAASHYSISKKVLDTLARLSTNTGDQRTARKVTGRLRPITDAEIAWLGAAVKALIQRGGEAAAGASPSPLTMGDLPPLADG